MRPVLQGVLAAALFAAGLLWFDDRERSWDGGAVGRVVYPPVPVPVLAQQLRGRWSLVQLAGYACEQECHTMAARLKRIQFALGEEGRRVQRLLILPTGSRHGGWDDDELQVWLMTEPQRHRLETACGRDAVCLIDPKARLLVRYGMDAAPSVIHDDIAHLLHTGS